MDDGGVKEILEDNQGAFLLATNQKLTPRSRYFSSKYHFFWSYTKTKENPDGWLEIQKCETKLQDADYLTKGLTRFLFEENRKRVQGW